MRTRLLRKAKKAVKLYRGHKGDLFISVQGVPRYTVDTPEKAQELYRLAVRAAAAQLYHNALDTPCGYCVARKHNFKKNLNARIS